MLTADLVLARAHGGELRLSVLTPKKRPRLVEIAADFIELTRSLIGHSREQVEAAWALLDVDPSEVKLAAAVQKLVEDACEFEGPNETQDPIELRRSVFIAAATMRKNADDPTFDRDSILQAEGATRGLTQQMIEESLYADLRGAQRLVAMEPLDAETLVNGFDRAQMQAVLLRAVKVSVEVTCQAPTAYRRLFAKLKFLRLLPVVGSLADGGYRIDLDGPMSLFESITKYGLQLAMALPAVMACDRWSLAADVRWGKTRVPLVFRAAGESAPAESNDVVPVTEDVASLVLAFRKLASAWEIVDSPTPIFQLPGLGVCIPDLTFRRPGHPDIHLEVLGFWSRDAVFRRVELVEQGLAAHVIFAVGGKLRVSEAVLDERAESALYVYKTTINARVLLDRLDALSVRLRRTQREQANKPKPSLG